MTIAGYPPAKHILGDLGIEAEVTTLTTAAVRIRATPAVLDAAGGVRAGVLAILVDVVGGAVAIRSVLPDWMATADLTLQMVGLADGPFVEARATILRRGRTTLVVEALVFNVAEDGPEVGEPVVDGAPGPVAWATMTFTILPGRGGASTMARPAEPPVRWVFEGEALAVPVVDALSISVLDGAAGRVSMPALEYAANSFGAVQGGVMALLADVAGAEAVGAAHSAHTAHSDHAAHSDHEAHSDLGAPVVVTDLQVAYLSLGRVGPIESRTTVFDSDRGHPPRSATVELVDTGADGRLTTVVSVGTLAVADAAVGDGPVERARG